MSERSLQRETAIYQAALELIAQGASPAAMKVQDIAQAAGIGKGTVYEYFSSKEEILRGMALYCFDSEIAHIRARFAACVSLSDLEDAVVGFIQDLADSRMATYKVIADSLGGSCPPCGAAARMGELRSLTAETMERLRRAGEIDPTLSQDYCAGALLSAAAGGILRLCAPPELAEGAGEDIRLLIHRALHAEPDTAGREARPFPAEN